MNDSSIFGGFRRGYEYSEFLPKCLDSDLNCLYKLNGRCCINAANKIYPDKVPCLPLANKIAFPNAINIADLMGYDGSVG